MTDQDTPIRRWYQFRLRTLLIVMTLFSIPFAWVSWKLRQARNEQAAVAWIEEMGGVVGRQYHVGYEKSWWHERTDEWFGAPVRDVTLGYAPIFPQIARFMPKDSPALTRENKPVIDLSPLTELSNIVSLSIRHKNVSDLTPLAGMKSLEKLSLEKMPVSDLTPLAGMKSLERLDLINTPVNDFLPLVGLPNLKELWIKDTSITYEQVEAFRESMPKCKIVHMRLIQ